jgi:hypothetical protein
MNRYVSKPKVASSSLAGTAIANRISDQRVTENVVRTKLGGTGSLTSFRGESFSIPEGDFLRSCGVVK